MKHLLPIFIVLISIYVSSCANQGSPTGGPKDTIPPILVRSEPPGKTLNYTDQTFEFEFNERVNADQLRTKLNITPTTENKFKTLIKKNTLIITFDEPFEDSTTYTLNFADGVGDITEKNPVVNFSYAFSTGPIIDSINIEGHIKELYNNELQKDILVGIFSIDDTLDVFSGKPRYFTQTDANGFFKIENIKTGYYKIYAYEDKDKNIKNDPQKEKHGFLADSLNLFVSQDSVDINIQLLDATQPKFVRSKTTGLYFDVLYNKYMSTYELTKLDSNNTISIPSNNFFKENSIVRFYPDIDNLIDSDSLGLQISVFDSLGNSVLDTVYVKFQSSKRKPEAFEFQLFPVAAFSIKDHINFELKFSKPIEQTNYDSIYVSYDSLKRVDLNDSIFIWNENNTQLDFEIPVDPKFLSKQIDSLKVERSKYDSLVRVHLSRGDSTIIDSLTAPNILPRELFNIGIPKGTFISIDKDSSEVIDRTYNFFDVEKTGQIGGEVITEHENYFLQLVSPKFKVIHELKNPTTFNFTAVKPGKYGFRVLIDSNNDGKWSPGNILKNIEPEPIYFHEEITDLKAGWFVENIEISF